MENENLTLDDLAGMVKKGFDGVDERFNSVENKLGKLEENQKVIIAKLENVVYRDEFDELKTRVQELEEAVLAIKPR